MQFKRVVVTGLGAVTPLGSNINDYWTNLVNGVSGAATITRRGTNRVRDQAANFVRFDAWYAFRHHASANRLHFTRNAT